MPSRSLIARDRTPNTPRDRIPISKTYSLQRHRQMRADKTDQSFNAIIHLAAAVINSR